MPLLMKWSSGLICAAATSGFAARYFSVSKPADGSRAFLPAVLLVVVQRVDAGGRDILVVREIAVGVEPGVRVAPYFPADQLPARTCVGVAGLALHALVEIDLI